MCSPENNGRGQVSDGGQEDPTGLRELVVKPRERERERERETERERERTAAE